MEKSRKKSKKLIKISFIFIAILLSLSLSISYYAYSHIKREMKKTYVESMPAERTIDTKKPLAIMLLGVDTGDSERGGAESWNGNTDSQIVLTLNPQTKTTTIISIQRDTMANILDDKGNNISKQKVNAAYPLGYMRAGISDAAKYALRTISAQSGIPIENFVALNMEGLVNLVDDVGGIDVVNDSGGDIYISNTEPQYKAVVPFIGEGKKQHINGEQALVFSRDRYHLKNGDYGRSAHQRQVLQQLMTKILSINSITKYQTFLKNISNDFKTNISFDAKNLLSLIAYKDCFEKIVSIQYEGLGSMVTDSLGRESSYQFIPTNVYLAVQNLLRKSMGNPIIQTLDDNLITYEKEFESKPNYYCLPSVTVTEKGKNIIYGVDLNGNFVSITDENRSNYIAK